MKLGIVCGLKSELDALGELPGALTGVSGAQPEKAEAEADRLIGQGAELLVSFGLAGGLDSALASGAFLLPAEIVDEAGRRHGADADWRGRLAAEIASDDRALLGAESVIDSVERKQALAAASGAIAVDMESHRVARAAERAGRPFLAIRAVADPADRALPPTALKAVSADGGVDVLATIGGLARRPWDLPALLALKADSDAALETLKRAASVLRALVSEQKA
ncbi:MAG: nucleoside phosphorylase [Pseudomonadota bacterium]